MNTYNVSEMNLTWDYTFPLKLYSQNRPTQAIPFTTGNKFPNFSITSSMLVGKRSTSSYSSTQLQQLTNGKPLVISFLSEGWNNYALIHLRKLQEAYNEILTLGGNLLVIVQGSVEEVKEFVQYFNVPFSVLADPEHKIASQLGLYDEEFPIWERISGISANVSIPAVYTIGRNGKIVYSAIDQHFDTPFSITEMLASVYGASNNIPVAIRQELAA